MQRRILIPAALVSVALLTLGQWSAANAKAG